MRYFGRAVSLLRPTPSCWFTQAPGSFTYKSHVRQSANYGRLRLPYPSKQKAEVVEAIRSLTSTAIYWMQTTGSGGESECISELSRSAAVEPNDRKAEPWISAHDERRLDALRAIDESSFSCVASLSCLLLAYVLYSWFHFKVIMCAGVGFFTDA